MWKYVIKPLIIITFLASGFLGAIAVTRYDSLNPANWPSKTTETAQQNIVISDPPKAEAIYCFYPKWSNFGSCSQQGWEMEDMITIASTIDEAMIWLNVEYEIESALIVCNFFDADNNCIGGYIIVNPENLP